MSLHDRITTCFTNIIQLQQTLLNDYAELMEIASQRLVSVLLNDRKIITCGNNRSAATAQYLSSALVNQFLLDRPSLPAICLSTDAITVSGMTNPSQFEDIYAKPLRALGQTGDILVIYTDDNYSSNMTKAITTAHDKDITVIAFTGDESGIIAALLHEADIEIRVPSNNSAHIQLAHLGITQCLCDLIDHQLFGG